MPNKYYLRSDRTAVQPDPNVFPPYSLKYGTPVDGPDRRYWHENNIKWEQHIKSLPALDVDPDYLKRLSPGWFEGEERYEILSPFDGSWIEVSKNRYDKEISHDRRLTIIALQEAEKGQEERVDYWKNLDVLIKAAVDKSFTESGLKDMAINGSDGNFKEIKEKFFSSIDVEQIRNKLAATPQPVTGEEAWEKWLQDSQWADPDDDDRTGKWMVEELKKAFEAGQAASRPSDAVEFAEWVLKSKYEPTIDRRGWVMPHMSISQSTQQLYQLFLNSKSPNPNK